jgi:uncharacterized RDD family membrane protein YckC
MVTRETVCAGFVDRFIAVLIDTIILLIPNLVFIYVVEGLAGNALSIVLNAVYTIYFWTSSGSTPGKSVMGLKVVSADGGALIPPVTAVLRYVGSWISAIVLLLGYLWVIWDPKHEAWHDKIAATKVIKYK